jgi:hypothetical protein
LARKSQMPCPNSNKTKGILKGFKGALGTALCRTREATWCCVAPVAWRPWSPSPRQRNSLVTKLTPWSASISGRAGGLWETTTPVFARCFSVSFWLRRDCGRA